MYYPASFITRLLTDWFGSAQMVWCQRQWRKIWSGPWAWDTCRIVSIPSFCLEMTRVNIFFSVTKQTGIKSKLPVPPISDIVVLDTHNFDEIALVCFLTCYISVNCSYPFSPIAYQDSSKNVLVTFTVSLSNFWSKISALICPLGSLVRPLQESEASLRERYL